MSGKPGSHNPTILGDGFRLTKLRPMENTGPCNSPGDRDAARIARHRCQLAMCGGWVNGFQGSVDPSMVDFAVDGSGFSEHEGIVSGAVMALVLSVLSHVFTCLDVAWR